MTTPENATNVASYAWELLDTASATSGAALGTGTSITVTKDMLNKYIKVTVTDTEGNKFSSDATLVTEDNTAEVTIVDGSGFQADGTALAGDTLSIVYGSAMGTPQNVTWYANDIVALSTDFTGGAANLDLVTGKTAGAAIDYVLAEGSVNVYAIVTTKDGKQIKSKNTVTLTSAEDIVKVSGLEIIDDYDTPTLSYAAADADALVKVTFSKAVDGDLYLYKESVSKYGNGNNTFKIAKADFNNAVQVTAAASLTAKEAVRVAALGGGVTNTGIYYNNADGSRTYLLKVADGNMATAFSPIRGTTYKAVFDQEAVTTDDIGATTRADVTVSDPFAAPYVESPKKIALTSHSAGVVPKITFYNEKDEVLTWMNGGTTAGLATDLGLNSVITYGETGSAKNKANKVTQTTDAAVTVGMVKGVLTGDQNLNAASTYFWATVTTVKGIYGATAETLESEIVAGSEAAFTSMNLVDDSTNPKDAVITFNALKTAGTVYVLQGTNAGSANNGVDDFDADDVSTYTGKAEVAKGDTKVTITGAIEAYADSATTGRYYTAYFVPTNTEDYAISWVNSYENTKQTVKSSTTSNNLVVAQIPTSIKYNAEGTAETVTTKNVTYDKTATESDEIAGGKIEAFDQFGDLMSTAQDAKTVTSCTASNNTLTTTEDANAQYEILGTGKVKIHVYRATDVDAGDGFDIVILGTTVKMRATNFVAHPAGTGYFGVTIGSDTVVKAAAGAAKLIVSDNAAVAAAVNTAGSFTMTGTTVTDEEGNLVKNTSLAVSDFTLGTMEGPTAIALSTDDDGVLVVTTTRAVTTDGTVTMTVLGKILTLTSSDTKSKLAVTSWTTGV